MGLNRHYVHFPFSMADTLKTEDPITETSPPLAFPLDDRYKLLVENLSDYGIYLLDPTGHVMSWNAGAHRIHQHKEEEILGQHVSVFYPLQARDNQQPSQDLQAAQQHGSHETEGWRVRKDGSVFWANVVTTPLHAKKQLIGFSTITRDFSERKKAEDDLFKAYEELKDREERFRLLVEGVTDYAIFMLDPVGNIATWNQGAKNIKGYEASEIIGKYFAKFYSREAIQTGFPEYELKKAREDGRFEDEGWRYRKDGSAFCA